MHVELEAFISYTHLDDLELVKGRKGWVTNLHRALEVRVSQLLGRTIEIWRDPKLDGNELFDDSIMERLGQTAVLLAVVSPRYVQSEWALKELNGFCSAAEQQGGIRVHEKARVFKIVKTPVPLEELPAPLQPLLGYEFFKVDDDTEKVRELDEVFGKDAECAFWIRLNDLAQDVCDLLKTMESPDSPAAEARPKAGSVYLAETTSDLCEYRETLRRDLRERGYRVLPDRALPLVAGEYESAARAALAECRLAIHMVGRTYGIVPEGGNRSIVEVQHALAGERDGAAPFSRIIWIPEGLKVQDDRQRQVIEALRVDPRIGKNVDLVETYFEGVRELIQTWIKKDQLPAPPPAPASSAMASSGPAVPRLYFIADERDVSQLDPWCDALFKSGLEVKMPIYKGNEADIREYHDDNLARCDGVLIFYGSGDELWVQGKLREVQKAQGRGRTKPPPQVGICLIAPRTPEKDRFRTHEATVIAQWNGMDAAALLPFVTALKTGRAV